MNKKAPFVLMIAVLLLFSINNAFAFYIVSNENIYFPSFAGAYINFDATLTPANLTTCYKDALTIWHFNQTGISTTTDLTITALNVGDWFNCTVSGAGTQTVDFPAIPTAIYLNGVEKNYGDGWTRSGDTVTITGATSTISISYAEAEFPEVDYTYPDYDRETVITGGDFVIYFNTNNTLSFSGNLDQRIYFEVTSGEWNGTDCRLNVWERSGVFIFHSETNTTLLAYTNGTGSCDLDTVNIQKVQLNGTSYNLTVTENNDCSITWQMKGGASRAEWLFGIGITGAVLMIASVIYLAFKIRGGIRNMDEIVERGYFALILFLIGFCMVVVWLGAFL